MFYTLKKEKKIPICFLVPPIQSVQRIVEFSFTQAQNILVFSFWFQLIIRIDQMFDLNTNGKILCPSRFFSSLESYNFGFGHPKEEFGKLYTFEI